MSTRNSGYFRFPAIHEDTIVFVCEDDLWTVDANGGTARRLTANLGTVAYPHFSPDGKTIAFTATEETHPEVFVMPAEGGPVTRLTYLGANTSVRGWTPDNQIVFVSDHGQPFMLRIQGAFTIDPKGGHPEALAVGPVTDIFIHDSGRTLLGRHTADPARWKRYRGGTKGSIWIDANGNGKFNELLDIEGNLSSPMWGGERIWFLSDHEGVGNLYSCNTDGSKITRHTDHRDYYARFAQTDGWKIVYQCGAEIWVYDPIDDTHASVDIDFPSPRSQRNRKFVEASRYLADFNVHPQGHSIAVEARGKTFTMRLWEEAVCQFGEDNGVRYRLTQWLSDGRKLATISDEDGEEAVEIYNSETHRRIKRLNTDLGRVTEVAASPAKDQLAVANHRNELIMLNVGNGAAKVIDASEHGPITGATWSADGKWIAYSFAPSFRTRGINLYNVEKDTTHEVTRPDFRDFAPAFDPEGKYLYFLSMRVFDPVYDSVFFDLGFPRSVRPHLVTLKEDEPSPFVPKPKGFGEPKKNDETNPKGQEEQGKKTRSKPSVTVDLDGIADRVIAFPVPEGRYTQIEGIKGKALFCVFPIEGSTATTPFNNGGPKGKIDVYDFKEQKHETLVNSVGYFKVSSDGGTLVYRSNQKLRAIKAGTKPDEKASSQGPGRRSGWLDLSRIKVSIDPPSEWEQMLREAWRLMRDHFWVSDMSGVDWSAIYERYRPLLDKVTTRLEFSDLMWEMQGELGTSHAYEMGGDHRQPPSYPMGYLGADFSWDKKVRKYRIDHIVKGDSWNDGQDSPLNTVGARVKEGDFLTSINGRQLSKRVTPGHILVNQAGQNVELSVIGKGERKVRNVVVKTLRSEAPARYREWVEANRAHVHEASGGKVGYIHIPNMMGGGFSEFHRYFNSELDRQGLIVDVRFNSGGHVSQLLLEKLSRKRYGYSVRRWGQPVPRPIESVYGPIVCLTNERSGSDGDIFTHCFKLLGLGPVVGKRTWGGVIGISPHHALVDLSVTTQPEHSSWFVDVGWGVENYGTDPDFDVDIKPQDYAAGKDPQMAKALTLVRKSLKSFKPKLPDMKDRPNLAVPKLPPRAKAKKAKPKTSRNQVAAAGRGRSKTSRVKHS